MIAPMPNVEEMAVAVVHVVTELGKRHGLDADELAMHGTPGDMCFVLTGECGRVSGVTAPPWRGRDGWWCVGAVHDSLAAADFDVWCVPQTRRIGFGRSREASP